VSDAPVVTQPKPPEDFVGDPDWRPDEPDAASTPEEDAEELARAKAHADGDKFEVDTSDPDAIISNLEDEDLMDFATKHRGVVMRELESLLDDGYTGDPDEMVRLAKRRILLRHKQRKSRRT
jgi:hypothetical protein